ncbi:hypothetical protein WOLCODRAFT_165258 [Wolfiporia cocos MD-104 SS10]|uniref:Uncharacterized protein n=1 Tax=Wolfiporia cocos (strain MD-104) TaxID=742152 RepID=A0A2H3JRN2_WOLCO|nr:hypothetical protein WOLCODRAFT_165258 [Wolfiporia cocos MD-104 SS10]
MNRVRVPGRVPQTAGLSSASENSRVESMFAGCVYVTREGHASARCTPTNMNADLDDPGRSRRPRGGSPGSARSTPHPRRRASRPISHKCTLCARASLLRYCPEPSTDQRRAGVPCAVRASRTGPRRATLGPRGPARRDALRRQRPRPRPYARSGRSATPPPAGVRAREAREPRGLYVKLEWAPDASPGWVRRGGSPLAREAGMGAPSCTSRLVSRREEGGAGAERRRGPCAVQPTHVPRHGTAPRRRRRGQGPWESLARPCVVTYGVRHGRDDGLAPRKGRAPLSEFLTLLVDRAAGQASRPSFVLPHSHPPSEDQPPRGQKRAHEDDAIATEDPGASRPLLLARTGGRARRRRR